MASTLQPHDHVEGHVEPVDPTDNEATLVPAGEDDEPTYILTKVPQQLDPQVDSPHVWGRLEPCVQGLPQLELKTPKLGYVIGRDAKCDFVITNSIVSSLHCTISYVNDVVNISDHSSNGTYVRGKVIGKGNALDIVGSPEISFGPPGSYGSHDIRFIFRPSSDQTTEVVGGGFYKVYERLSEIGRGGFGVVHQARDKDTKALAAVKIIIKSRFLNSWDSFTRYFKREINIMGKLAHENIVKFIDQYEDAGAIYIVMELVDGGDLRQHIRNQPGGHMGEPEAKKITRFVGNGLDYIHNEGIAHRDLKPENILLTGDGMAKIADFGLAKMFDSQTFLNTQCGTPAYIAPEVFENQATGYSLIVDSWSMGVIVYDMLTGENRLHERFRRRNFDTNGLLEPPMSQAAQEWIRAMLQVNPEARLPIQTALQHSWLIVTGSNP
ncbi:kinase-like protein [Clavulina sp. PMI_390]|nr:kinase-like protein [Clavulina sp. PMI_390]